MAGCSVALPWNDWRVFSGFFPNSQQDREIHLLYSIGNGVKTSSILQRIYERFNTIEDGGAAQRIPASLEQAAWFEPIEAGSMKMHEARWHKLVHWMKDPAFAMDAQTLKVLEANEAAANALGYAGYDLIGRDPSELLCLENFDSIVRKSLADEEASVTGQLIARDGRRLDSQLRFRRWTVEGPVLLCATIKQPPPSAQCQSILAYRSILEGLRYAIALLQRDIQYVHEIIERACQTITEQVSERNTVGDALRMIRRAVHEAMAGGTRLGRIGKGVHGRNMPLEIQPYLEGLVKFAEALSPEAKPLHIETPGDLPVFEGPPALLETVLQLAAIIITDWEMCSCERSLTVNSLELSMQPFDDWEHFRPGRYLCLHFESHPSKTAHESKNYSDLSFGGAQVQNFGELRPFIADIALVLCRAMRGCFKLNASNGQPASCCIYLREREVSIPKAGQNGIARNSESCSTTILLVVNEPMVQSVLHSLLERASYKVASTTEPFQALEWCRNGQNSVQLFVTDMLMWPLNGVQLAKEVRRLVPDVQILFISEFAPDIPGNANCTIQGAACLQKPLHPKVFLSKIDEVLKAAATQREQ